MEEEPMAKLGRKRAIVAALVLSVALGMTVGPAAAEEDDHRFATDFGLGVGAFFTNLVYMPVKFVYATLGGVTGGFAYVLTGFNYSIAKSIWVPSTGGDYVVTPSMLRGDQPIYFSGTTQPKRESRARGEEDLDTNSKRDADGTAY
jgi:hypothetical protein